MVGIFAPQVVVANRSPGKVDTTVERAAKEGIKTLRGTKSPAEFISSLSKPRKVILLVMAGNPVDDTIAQLSDLMDEGDMIIDGGNEWFPNSVRRSKVGEGRQGGITGEAGEGSNHIIGAVTCGRVLPLREAACY